MCNNIFDSYIPEKRKFPGILCFRQQHSRRHFMDDDFLIYTQPIISLVLRLNMLRINVYIY